MFNCALGCGEADVTNQSADEDWMCIAMFLCLPRPRKRGTLHGVGASGRRACLTLSLGEQ
jgi:hypothetical protein